MTLKEQMEADQDVFFNPEEFGRIVTYNGVDITAIVDSHDFGYEQYPEVRNAEVSLLVKSADVSDPKAGDSVILGEDTYQVYDPVERDPMGLFFRLALGRQMVRI